MKVSIIIPVYNTEKYVGRCIESCLKQTLEDLEIILIDDCSTDGSRDVILSYAKQYPEKIKYIFQPENHRQGAARNRGMEIASGEYFAFVDSDDWIEPTMCKDMYDEAVSVNADMVGSNYYLSWEDKNEEKLLSWHNEDVGNMSKEKREHLVSVCGMFWTRIYKAGFLKRHKLVFPEDIYYEDAFFNLYSILFSDRVAKVEKAYYHYFQNDQSTMRNRNQEYQYDRITSVEYLYGFMKENSELEIYKDTIYRKYLGMACSNILYTCLDLFDKPDIKQMKRIHKLIQSKDKHYTGSKPFRQINERVRFFAAINACSSRLCVLVYRFRIYDILRKVKTIIQ